jgi:hypothetical protein
MSQCTTPPPSRTKKGKKKNEILCFATTWMELETFILNKIKQTQKEKDHKSFHLYMEPKKVNFIEVETTMVVSRS